MFNYTNKFKLGIVIVCLVLFCIPIQNYAGSLTCSITTAGACTGTVVYRMSGTSNAHAELPSQSNTVYDNNVVCCTGVTGLGNSCSGTNATVVKLSSVTNAHVEIGSQTNYTNKACISVGAGGYVNVGWQSTNCTGYDTTLGSIESTTNSQVGNTTAYTTKICASASSTPLLQYIAFTLSTNTVNFGATSYVQTRYASSTAQGDVSETEALNIKVNTNAPSGYIVTVQGATLTFASSTITAIGNTNTAPSVGTEQFGMRATVSGSNGVVAPLYAGSGFAYNANATNTDILATSPVGDSATSTYSVRLMVNTAVLTEAGNYTSNLVYVATANF